MKKLCLFLAAAVLAVGCGGDTSKLPAVDRGKGSGGPAEEPKKPEGGKPGTSGPTSDMKPL